MTDIDLIDFENEVIPGNVLSEESFNTPPPKSTQWFEAQEINSNYSSKKYLDFSIAPKNSLNNSESPFLTPPPDVSRKFEFESISEKALVNSTPKILTPPPDDNGSNDSPIKDFDYEKFGLTYERIVEVALELYYHVSFNFILVQYAFCS